MRAKCFRRIVVSQPLRFDHDFANWVDLTSFPRGLNLECFGGRTSVIKNSNEERATAPTHVGAANGAPIRMPNYGIPRRRAGEGCMAIRWRFRRHAATVHALM